MSDTGTERVKNLALVGQGGVGKTMLAEAMLHLTGRTTRLGGHAGTKPTLDYDSEEGARGFSISTTIAPVTWKGTRINVLDAPCYPDFVGDAYGALAAAETALFVVDAASGPGAITTRLWYAAEDLSLARAIMINRLDRPDADWDTALLTAQERFGSRLAAVTIPMGSGDGFSGIIDVVHMTARHLEDGKPVAVDTVVISTQHNPDVEHDQIARDMQEYVIRPEIPAELLTAETRYYINPTGRFVIGGPAGDTGLTGRKIIVDTYGGYAPHGGGAFSGKDPTKVDRSAAYAARHVCKNIVAAGLAKQCELQLAYAIGVAHPVSLLVDTKGTGVVSDERLSEIVAKLFDLRPNAIIERFDLRRPIYRQTASYGHMGRTDIDLPWERLDYVDALKAEVKN